MRLPLWLPVLFASHVVFAQEQPIRLWAVSENVRVSPVTGNLIENKPLIHKDYPTGNPRDGNLVWNASTKTVTLKAARNEFTAFQLIIETVQPQNQIDVKFASLNHVGGAAKITGKDIAIFKEWYVKVRRPSTGYEGTSLGRDWYPDALMPYRHATWLSCFPFSIPDLYNNIPNQKNHAIWIDIFVPYDRAAAPPGRYKGTVEVTWQGGGKDSVNVVLDVWDFALPQENHIKGDIWNGSIKNMPPEEELQYYQLAKQHRFLPLIYAYRPRLKVQGTTVELDWTEYDKRLGKYLDGSAFTDKYGYSGPGYGVPISHLMLPFDIERHGNASNAWPLALPKEGRTPEYEAVWKEVGRQIREHLDSNSNARKVMKVAFLNGLDESYNEEAYEKMIYYGKLLQQAMGRDWFKYRIDGGYSREAMEKLQQVVTLWVAHTVSWDVDKMEYFRKRGVESWFYGPMIYEQRKNSGCGSNTFLDLDLLVNRAIGWIGWKYRSGWVEWELDWNAFAAWYEAENFKEPRRIYNGSGQLIYRGVVMGYNQPIPSIRLKAQRRGLQDYEYFWLLAQKTGNQDAADRIVNRIVYKNPFGKASIGDTEIWKNNPDEWEKARIEAGEMIAGK
jgi:hypothetical protein